MTDVIVDTISLSVSNGPDAMRVLTGVGPQGSRGNLIFINTGAPATLTSYTKGNYYLYGNLLQANDIYVRKDSMLMFQFKQQPGGMAWVQVSDDAQEYDLLEMLDSATRQLGIINIWAASWYA